MAKILIADSIADEGVELLRSRAEVDVKVGLKIQELLDILGEYDALVVRIRNTEGMGGIWKPVRLIVSDQLMDERQVKALVTVRNRFPDTIHE